ncbi:ArnT family glycosyltransferase [Luteimonas sp. SDU101]|uniref:ArnT family glycosyltransferase n=1 Tax=unclassified Luteimonas TaxID=2629088 RepID=UPI003EB6F573
MQERSGQRTAFIALWTCAVVAKLLVAARLPLFVDEAFYWQEGQHLAWAYSDLPGLTAWTIRLGGELFGDSVLAARSLFVAISAALPWLVVRIAGRELEPAQAWIAGCGALVLPLFATLGVMALPDVLMALATLLCLDALTRMLRQVSYGAAVQLALGLAIGALSHYRFIAAIGAGLLALLLIARGRELLRDPRVIIAVAFGAAAWMPLLAWNIENAEAGLRFQLVDRHPWALHRDGASFVPIQAAFVTPLLLVALLAGAWRVRRHDNDALRLLGLSGGIVVLGFFALGFFADTERVSFHWPLPGYIALLPLLPLVLGSWPRWLRVLTWAIALVGTLSMLGYYAAVSSSELRERSAAGKWYPQNFSGWDELAAAVRKARADMSEDTRLIADNFKVGAELGFALGDPAIPVLPHALNRAHGRAPQLQLWGLEASAPGPGDGPALLVVSPSDVKLSELLDHYQSLCRRFGALPPPQVVDADGGGRRFLLFALDGETAEAPEECVPPAIAYLNTPRAEARLPAVFEASGWAIKDVAGVKRVSVTLGGRVVAEAEYGLRDDWPQQFYRGRSKDPSLPQVAFRAQVDASGLPPGRYWLGLEVVGGDGSIERFAGQPVELLGE